MAETTKKTRKMLDEPDIVFEPNDTLLQKERNRKSEPMT